jgi:hypothetical protein
MCGLARRPTVISPKPHRAANEEETDMANGNDMNTAQSPRYETPTFDPRGVFSWTLRAGEIARLEAQRQRNEPRDPKTSVARVTQGRGAPRLGSFPDSARRRLVRWPRRAPDKDAAAQT